MRKGFLPYHFFFTIIIVLFNCERNNNDPSENSELRFTSSPQISVFHNELYSYSITTEGGKGECMIEIEEMPDWLDFDKDSLRLFGKATAGQLGVHEVSISLSDTCEKVYQNFSIEVTLKQVDGGPWIGHLPHNWQHDGQPLIGENSIIYSDAAGDNVKIAVSDRVEYAFNDIKGLFDITGNEVFTFLSENHKIDIYANRFNTEYVGGFAYNAGAIIISPDSPFYRPAEGWCVNEIEHEMMHVMEYLLEGGRRLILSEVWFREGIADFYAGNNVINNLFDMNKWLASRRSLPGGGNPIKIHLWEDFPNQVAVAYTQGLWYPMFELSVRYLLDPRGQGKTMIDVRNMFLDMDLKQFSFPEAFEANFSISLEYFEDHYWSLMEDYLK